MTKETEKKVSRLTIIVSALLWITVFCLLTLSGTGMDFFRSLAISALHTAGMVSIFYSALITNRKCTPTGLLCNIIYLILTILALAVIVFIFNSIENAIVLYMCDSSTQQSDMQYCAIAPIVRTSMLFAISYLASIIYYFVRKHENNLAEKEELERKTIKAELKFLQSQINPHFLFNALNNIYSMVYIGDKGAAEAVLTLSDILRYMIDHSKEELVTLKDAIYYLKKNINFQKFCHGDEVNISFDINILSDSVLLPPMILQPFVENCFKYSGIGKSKDAFIKITLNCDNHTLRFHTLNSKHTKVQTESKREGLGIQNVAKRLKLLFPGKHSINIRDGEDDFEVDLSFAVRDPKIKKDADIQQS